MASNTPTNHTIGNGESPVMRDTSDILQSDQSKSIEMTLNYLTTLAIAIRKAGTRHRDVRAEQYGKKDPGYQSMREETGDLIKSIKISGLFRELKHTEETLTEQLDVQNSLLERLIDCNMNRWSRFMYAKHHDKNLSEDSAVVEIRPTTQPRIAQLDIPKHRTGPEVSLDHFQGPEEPSKWVEPEATTISKPSTTGTPIDREAYHEATQPSTESDSEPHSLRVAGSFVAGKIRLKYPPPPKAKGSSKHFKCSCCRQPLSIEFAEKETWRFVPF